MEKQTYIEKVNAARQHSYNYYVLSAPTISDAEFDALVSDIEAIEQEHPEWTLPDSPTQTVGSDLNDNGRRLVRHRTPMLSCQKAQTTEKVTEWLQKMKKKVGGGLSATPMWMLSWKADGISCSLVYQDGHLIEASTRGDGPVGQDLMQHVRLMHTVPQTIEADEMKGRVEVRGEIVCPKANLKGLTDMSGKQYADCRSAASSLCNQATPSADMARLEFWAWDCIGDDLSMKWQDHTCCTLQRRGFKTCYHETDDGTHIETMLQMMAEKRDLLLIPVDGIVIRINDNKLFQAQGFTDHHPKGSIAYKFPAQTTESRVRRIEITVGATGRRTPVAWFDPVTILGRTVEKASLGSEAKMQELGVVEGCTVEVGLSNDVIPKIYRVTSQATIEDRLRSALLKQITGNNPPVDEKPERVPKYIGPTVSPADIETTKDAAPIKAGQRLNVVISGCFTDSATDGYGRDAARQTIISMGHKVQSSMSKTTNYLVIGTADVPGRGVGPSKLAQAKNLGIPVVTLEEFKRLAA